MFRANPQKPFKGPHQKTQRATAGADADKAPGAVIFIHGRGASANSILPLSRDLDAADFHLVAPQANGNTWYPYSFLMPTEKNEPGLSSGLQAIADIITDLESKGVSKEQIILCGFSQGACLASEYVARHPARYGGLIAFSGGLIGDSVNADNYNGSLKNTPFFIGCSDIDSHIPVERVHDTAEIMEKLGAAVTKKVYPGMGHTIIADEVEHAKKIIEAVRFR